jgi:hypothetical protein
MIRHPNFASCSICHLTAAMGFACLPVRLPICVMCCAVAPQGRLILCDAIWEAANGSSQTPDVLIDAATLTGGAQANRNVPRHGLGRWIKLVCMQTAC